MFMEYTSLNIDWDVVIPGLIAGLVTGACMWVALWLQHKHERDIHTQKEDAQVKAFVHAIMVEVETLWAAYYEGAGKRLEALEKGKAFMYFYPISQDYFTVYNGSAFLVGKIEHARLRRAIVETYTKARGLIDGFTLNNDMVQKWNHLDLMRQDSQNPTLIHMMWMQEQSLVHHAVKLREIHRQTKESLEHLLLIAKTKGIKPQA
jgi:hypothetical protein